MIKRTFGASSLLIYCHVMMVFMFFSIFDESYSIFEIYHVPTDFNDDPEAIKFVQVLNNLCFFNVLFAVPIGFTNYLFFKNDQPIGDKTRFHIALLISLLALVVFLSASDIYMNMENIFAPDWNRKNLPLLLVTSFPGLIILFAFHSIKKLTL